MVRTRPRTALFTAGLLLLTACGAGGPEAAPPEPPAGLTVHASSSTAVHVMWNRVDEEAEIAGYEVYRQGEKVEEVEGGRYMVDVTGLEPETEYTFAVKARGKDGSLSRGSRAASVTTLDAASEDAEAPTRPTGLRGEAAGARAARLTWQAAGDNHEVTSYDVYQGDARVHSVGGGETSTLVTGLRPGTDYAFTVKARDGADNSSEASGTVHLTTSDGASDDAATAPADFAVRSEKGDRGHYLELSWTPPDTGGTVPEYQIHLDGEFATTLAWGADAPEGKAEYRFFVTEETGTRYRVKLRARLPDGTWGSFSTERSVTTGGWED